MSAENRPPRVAIVGAGPAGIYAADALMKSGTAKERGVSRGRERVKVVERDAVLDAAEPDKVPAVRRT